MSCKNKLFHLICFAIILVFFSSCSTSKKTAKKSNNKKNHIQNKYAKILNVPAQKIDNIKLYQAVDSWLGTPYRYGGDSKKGVDCSALVQGIYKTAYGKSIPRTTKDIYKRMKRVKRSVATEGDIIFFNTIKKKKNSHVGIYLKNGKFVHSSSSKGVMISDLRQGYYKKKVSKFGRFR